MIREDIHQQNHQARCTVCHRACLLPDGMTGACHARRNEGGVISPAGYGLLTSVALDPIEKKPLARYLPGAKVLSVGSFGCNLKCPFCQNCEISCARMEDGEVVCTTAQDERYRIPVEQIAPDELCAMAWALRDQGNAGVAYTYNEPLVCYEYVRDTAALVHRAGMKNVLVTAGCVSQEVLHEVLPYTDAMNIDLKSFRASFYTDLVKGDLDMVRAFITEASAHCHVELTTLIIPGENDTEEEMEEEARWIASLHNGRGREIPLHVSRFFPRHRMSDKDPTEVAAVYRLAEVARRHLHYVYTGNC